MAVFRTIMWVLLLVGLILFSIANWQPGVSVRIWSDILVDTRLPAVVVIAFLLGFVPMWLYHRGVVWNLKRRIGQVENAARQPTAGARVGDNKALSDPVTATAPEPLRPTRPSDGLAPEERA